jgi:penicillin-binding protein 1A
MLRALFKLFLSLCFIGIIGAGSFCYWFYNKYLIDLPNLKAVSDYKPPAVTQVFTKNNELLAEYFFERRYPVKIDDVPEVLIKAILAAEDVDFYKHPGVDLWGIFRALGRNLQEGAVLQGGSTITQQVVKNLILDSRKTFERKAKEAILSYRLEKQLTKNEILEIYLNQIYFGNTAYGVKAAAKEYFKVELRDLSLAQAAMLAALPKAPSHYSPISNLPKAKNRQRYVLEQMLKSGFIEESEFTDALNENLKYYTANPEDRFYNAPYFLREFNVQFAKRFPNLNLESDGLKIYTTNDSVAQSLAEKALRSGIRAVDKRQGYRGPLAENVTTSNYLEKFKGATPERLNQIYSNVEDATIIGQIKSLDWSKKNGTVQVGNDTFSLTLTNSSWLKKRVSAEGRFLRSVAENESLKINDVVELNINTKLSSLGNFVFSVTQTPKLEGACVLLNPNNGQIGAMVGGYDYSRSSFNRVVQSYRQPGSAFKPVVYLAAVDKFNYTSATMVNDTPRAFKINGKYWEPANFDRTFLGPITLQTALERSRNIVVAELIADIGIDSVVEYAEKLGIEAKLGKNLSLALGSAEVPLLEMTRAYGVIGAGGVLNPTNYITRIEDRFGREIYNSALDSTLKPKEAISAESAFILTHMLRGVVERGTATSLKVLGREIAGKTGTTNNQMDAWFIGYDPNWVFGVWVGFDKKQEIGSKETGGKVAAPIWLQFMDGYLKFYESSTYLSEVNALVKAADVSQSPVVFPPMYYPKAFIPPSTLSPIWINRYSGYITSEDDPQKILMYFKKDTEPTQAYEEEVLNDYFDSPEL